MHAAAAALAKEGGKKGFLKARAPTDATKVKSAAAAAAFRKNNAAPIKREFSGGRRSSAHLRSIFASRPTRVVSYRTDSCKFLQHFFVAEIR